MRKVENRQVSPRLGETRIGGSIGELMEKFFTNRIYSEYARTGVYQEAEDAFKHKVDDASGVHGLWQGEFWGKWMLGAVQACEYSGNAELKEFIRRGARQLLAYQDADGYIGTYRNSANVLPADPAQTEKILGWPCVWNWNIWCRKYTLWGLLECYRLLGDREILAGCVKLADHLLKQLQDQGINIRDTGTFVGLPSCSILKPMLLLYEYTADRRYLDFSLDIAAGWEAPDGRAPNLIGNGLAEKPIAEWYPQSEKWAKVYELLSCLDGLLELHRVTGEAKFLLAVKKLHATILRGEGNPLYSVGFNDMFGNAAPLINALSEPCDVIHWLRLSSELFVLTGESHYLDTFELSFYNAFLAGVYRDGQWGSRCVRSHGRHYTSMQQAGFTKNHCCVNNMPRAFMNFAEVAVTVEGAAVFVNLYTDFSAKLATSRGEVRVEIGGSYLADGRCVVKLDAELSGEAELRLRIPAWSRRTVIRSNGREWTGEAGGYISVPLPAKGGSVFELQFDLTPVIRDASWPQPDLAETDWRIVRWCLLRDSNHGAVSPLRLIKSPRCLLQAGPLLLARSKYIGSTEAEMFAAESLQGGGYSCRLTPVASDQVRQAFVAEFTSGSRRFSTRVCDYASAGNALVDDDGFFSIYF